MSIKEEGESALKPGQSKSTIKVLKCLSKPLKLRFSFSQEYLMICQGSLKTNKTQYKHRAFSWNDNYINIVKKIFEYV